MFLELVKSLWPKIYQVASLNCLVWFLLKSIYIEISPWFSSHLDHFVVKERDMVRCILMFIWWDVKVMKMSRGGLYLAMHSS